MATAAQRDASSGGGASVETAVLRDVADPDVQADRRATAGELYVTCWRAEPGDEPIDRAHPVEYAAAAGLPGRGVVMVSLLACAASAVTDVSLTGGVTMFFDLWFVTVCLVGAMAVRRADLFTAGVLAPLVFAAAILLVSWLTPDAFVRDGGISREFLTGLAQHAEALVAGYGVALATVAGRVAAARA